MATAAKCRIWAGLACAWRTLPYKNHLTENQSLIHSIDREADSVYHLRGWDAAGHPFLVRMRRYSGVARDGKVCKAREFGRETRLQFLQKRALPGQTGGAGSGTGGSCIDAEIQCQTGQRAACPAESQNNLCAVEDGKEDGTVDTADECGNYGVGSGAV